MAMLQSQFVRFFILSAIVVFILVLYAFGILASEGVPSGNEPISLQEAIEIARQALPGFSNNNSPGFSFLFVPFAILLYVVYLLMSNKPPIARIVVLFFSLILPFFFIGKWVIYFYLPIIAPMITFGMLFSSLDGETYSEGFVCLAALGYWMLFVLFLLFIEYKNKSKKPEKQ